MKRFKENLKEEEKYALKRAELSASKATRKVAVNKAKLDLHTKRQEKVRARDGMARGVADHTLSHPPHRKQPSTGSK